MPCRSTTCPNRTPPSSRATSLTETVVSGSMIFACRTGPDACANFAVSRLKHDAQTTPARNILPSFTIPTQSSMGGTGLATGVLKRSRRRREVAPAPTWPSTAFGGRVLKPQRLATAPLTASRSLLRTISVLTTPNCSLWRRQQRTELASGPTKKSSRRFAARTGAPPPAPSPKSFAVKADAVEKREPRRTWGRGYYRDATAVTETRQRLPRRDSGYRDATAVVCSLLNRRRRFV